MASGKALVYGPVKNWGKKGIKVLLKNGEEGRQYTLEGVTEWEKVGRFQELQGGSKMQEAMERAREEAVRLAGEKEGFRIVYSREERLSRGSNEILVVKDGTTAERALEIISSGLVIQDVTESDEIPEESITSSVRVEGDEDIEEVTMRTNLGKTSWVMRTPRTARRLNRGKVEFLLNTTAEDLNEDRESDNEAIRLKSARKEKKIASGETLSQIGEEFGYSSSFIKEGSETPAPITRSLFPPGKAISDSQEEAGAEGDDFEDSDIDLGDLVEAEYGVFRTLPSAGLAESRHASKGLFKEEADVIVKRILDKASRIGGEEEFLGKGEDGNEEIGGEDSGGVEEVTSRSYDLPSDRRGMWELVRDLVANLKTIEEIEVIKGGRPFQVRRNLAAAKSAVNTAGLILDQGGASDATGGNSWEDLEDEAMESRDMERMTLVRRAKRGYGKVVEGGMSALEGLGKKVDKLSEMVATLAVLNGFGTPEDCEKARKLQAKRQAQVVEAKRAAAEVKKISAKEKEEREMKKGLEEANLAAEKAIRQVETLEEEEDAVKSAAAEEIEKYEAMDKNTAEPKEVAEAARRYEEAQRQIEKIEERRKLNPEVHVGKGLVVIGKRVHKTVTIIMAHRERLVGVRRANLQQGVIKVNALLREAAQSEGRSKWTATGSVDASGGDKESRWEIGRVPEEVSVRGVLGRVVPQLVAFFGAQDDFDQAWVKRDDTVRLVAVDAPMEEDKTGKELDTLLREENVGVKWGDRYPSHYGCWNKKLGVVFEVENSQEARKIVKKGIMWKNKLRKVAYVKSGTAEESYRKEASGKVKNPSQGLCPQKSIPGGTPPSGPKGWQWLGRQSKARGNPQSGVGFARPYVGWSNVRCFRCGGAGHIQSSCTSRSRMWAPAIEYRGPGGSSTKRV